MPLPVADVLSPDVRVPALGLFAALVALGYFLSRARFWWNNFTLFDGAMIVMAMVIGTAAAVPLLDAANNRANSSVLLYNLRVLRGQIELYKTEHGGEPPLLYRGTFPQLTQATDALGVPGRAGPAHPYGPYLRNGLPVNPITGLATVTPVPTYPPAQATGNGGWVYHQATGKIGADLAEFLTQ